MESEGWRSPLTSAQRPPGTKKPDVQAHGSHRHDDGSTGRRKLDTARRSFGQAGLLQHNCTPSIMSATISDITRSVLATIVKYITIGGI